MNKKYKKFLKNTFLLYIMMIFIFTGSFLAVIHHIVQNHLLNYTEHRIPYGWIEKKVAIAKELDKKGSKIVFIAGSNGLYGVNALAIEKEIKKPVLNMCTYAGLCEYMFKVAKRAIKPGDTVILPLEYQYYEKDYDEDCSSSVLLEYVLTYDIDYLNSLPLAAKLKYYHYLMSIRTLRPLKNAKEPRVENCGEIQEDRASSCNLDERGDITGVVGKKPDEQGIRLFEDERYNFNIEKSRSSHLTNFILYCKENNIKVYAISPNAYGSEYLKSEDFKKEFEKIKAFYASLGVKFLEDEPSGFYDKSFMHDTAYHLNEDGQRLRSKYLIELIKKNNL